MSTPTIKPIETRYAGCRFRLRLEARWAVFFDALGVPWEYEPEGYETPAGWYLPDFRLTLSDDLDRYEDDNDRLREELTTRSVLFEVKPDSERPDRRSTLPRNVGDPRWSHLADAGHTLFVTYGLPRPIEVVADGFPRSDTWHETSLRQAHGDGEMTGGMYFAACPHCTGVNITTVGCLVEHEPPTPAARWPFNLGTAYWRCCGVGYEYDGPFYTPGVPRINRAFIAARSARFEHGQQGGAA